jgi:hypothetical protein
MIPRRTRTSSTIVPHTKRAVPTVTIDVQNESVALIVPVTVPQWMYKFNTNIDTCKTLHQAGDPSSRKRYFGGTMDNKMNSKIASSNPKVKTASMNILFSFIFKFEEIALAVHAPGRLEDLVFVDRERAVPRVEPEKAPHCVDPFSKHSLLLVPHARSLGEPVVGC